ncbi:MAG TPA: cupin domain-containing protein [Actinomycetota bacterium]|nr:cupin domain-containing protein [Actinomycetota bacterium]
MTVGTLDRVRAGRGPLERCTGDPRSFLTDDWGRRAAVRLGGRPPADFQDLLSLDDVDRFLTTTALRTPFFRLVRAGERIPEASYTRTGRTGSRDVGGIADPARVAALFEDGATIVLQGLHRWSEPVARFCRDLELELGHPCQLNAYVTPPGAQGLELHEDAHDVFVLQAFGRKRWELHAAPREDPRDPHDVELAAGGTIYLPAGTPHAARAQDVLSGHLTVGVHVTSWRDVLSGVIGRITALDDAAVPAGWLDDVAGFADELRGRLAALAGALDAVDVRAVAGERRERFLSNRAQLARGTIAERTAPIEVDDDAVVARRAGSLCELVPHHDVLVALLGDRRLEMPPRLEGAMRRVADLEEGSELVVRDLAADLPGAASRAVLVRRLVREGLLTIRGGR